MYARRHAEPTGTKQPAALGQRPGGRKGILRETGSSSDVKQTEAGALPHPGWHQRGRSAALGSPGAFGSPRVTGGFCLRLGPPPGLRSQRTLPRSAARDRGPRRRRGRLGPGNCHRARRLSGDWTLRRAPRRRWVRPHVTLVQRFLSTSPASARETRLNSRCSCPTAGSPASWLARCSY